MIVMESKFSSSKKYKPVVPKNSVAHDTVTLPVVCATVSGALLEVGYCSIPKILFIYISAQKECASLLVSVL